jgi:hypothetical protein
MTTETDMPADPEPAPPCAVLSNISGYSLGGQAPVSGTGDVGSTPTTQTQTRVDAMLPNLNNSRSYSSVVERCLAKAEAASPNLAGCSNARGKTGGTGPAAHGARGLGVGGRLLTFVINL